MVHNRTRWDEKDKFKQGSDYWPEGLIDEEENKPVPTAEIPRVSLREIANRMGLRGR